MFGIAARLADITGATIIASVGVTDQSMMRRTESRWNLEGSRGSWIRFAKGTLPQKLPSKYIDALQQLHMDGVPSAVTAGPREPGQTSFVSISLPLQPPAAHD
jgi:hypothetical protein